MKVYDREKSNKFPKCFSMEIDAESVNASNGFNNGNRRKYQLFLSFCFSDQHEEYLEEHTIQIGIKGGELNLELARAEMSLSNVCMGKELDIETSIKKERKSESASERNFSISGSPNFSIKSNKDLVIDEQYTFTNSIVRLSSHSSPTDITWKFESPIILKGHCKEQKLGIIELIAYPCYAEVTFAILAKDIDLIMIKNPSGKEINRSFWTRNKYAVFQTKVVKQIGIGTPDFHISKVKLKKDK